MSTGKTHPGPRKVYSAATPGGLRHKVGVTLTMIKKEIVLAGQLFGQVGSRASVRRNYRDKGLLA